MLILAFFIAAGAVLGGSIVGGIGAFLVKEPPLETIYDLAKRIKIWALVAAIGGTFDMITNIERGFFYGTPIEVLKQILLVLSAMSGANTGMTLIEWLTQQERLP
ncbi:YtrH family sporulation protein [Bacillus taeanensis]|uniref:Sporulation protein n=1 Tax=Bacillus taeanensis TaxID=273032 RepID=A0A366Y2N2_9BACI|nr:YtrH family sporulation protein [Bacillus taeanensis]RBW71635.1 sporulation protein [Bacillus taeanensis]